MPKTEPIDAAAPQTASRLTIAPSHTDPRTGAVYVHQDYVQAVNPYAVEEHIAPINTKERFGDVASWADYVTLYALSGENAGLLLTWSETGLKAVLDYHGVDRRPGRCQWQAVHSFERSHQWNRWALLADGRPRSQRALLETLEDCAEDIVEPSPADLLAMLRTLRATASSQADTELLADGSTKVVWRKETGVKSAERELPPEITIRIPVLKGHTEPSQAADRKQVPVLYQLAVRVRVSVDDQAHLAFRLSMPNKERTEEAVFADRVEAAQALLGDSHRLYRAAER